MSRARISLTFDVVLLSPLHVGSGKSHPVAAVEGDPLSNTRPDVAAIQRDADGLPFLPGSTLKGLFRRLARTQHLDPKETEKLLGSPMTRGALIISGSRRYKPGQAAELPYADRSSPGELKEGVYVVAGTRIEGAIGVAHSSSLRHAQAVAKGAVFSLALAIETRGPDAGPRADAALALLRPLLALLCLPEGQAIGAHQADGDGRIQLLKDTLRITKAALDTKGEFLPRPLPNALPAVSAVAPVKCWKLRLHCDGPFAVLDPYYARLRQRQPDPGIAAQRAQRRSSTTPEIPGASLAGALRARAAWLAGLDALANGRDPVPDDPTVVYDRINGPALTPVQRLFGATGFAALLRIEALTVESGAKIQTIHSVKLDRFTGGPMSGALFGTEIFLGVTAHLVLALHDRGGMAQPTLDDIALADTLKADLHKNGILLGHGTNKGFGWFTVSEE